MEYLKTAPEEIRMVAYADKLHNVRSMLVDYRKVGEALWERFKRGREGAAGVVLPGAGGGIGSPELERIFRQFAAAVEELLGR